MDRDLGQSYRVGDRLYVLIAKDPDQYQITKIPGDIGLYLAPYRSANRVDGKPMTQGELAIILSYSQRQVSRIERGEVVLGDDEVARVLRLLG
jgi:hypothetical protein